MTMLRVSDRGVINSSVPMLCGYTFTKIGTYHDTTLGEMFIILLDSPPPGHNPGILIPEYCLERLTDE